jgi:molybdopterin-containing oxidoreductase family membrane subunit
MFAGTFGLFLSMFLLFVRFMPMIAIAEVKGVMPAADPHPPGHGAHDDAHDHGHQTEAAHV